MEINMDAYFKTEKMDVGYNGNILIHDINIEVEKGKILTLIGPNGAGKSTILKSITRQISKIHGTVYIDSYEISELSLNDMAKKAAVVLTDRIHPEMMTCAELVAMGRYPYTNMIGKLTLNDKNIVREALKRVHALELESSEFSTLSDGQKQRILLARAICQEPEIIVLDEPTAYLDIRHKIELLDILNKMAKEKGITIIMSLHEIDLATKISDYIMCVKGETIEMVGSPEEILKNDTIENLYDIKNGSYNLNFGSVELAKVKGKPKAFVIAGGGFGIPYYRLLQKKQIPFATGVLFENDIDCQVAKVLSDDVVTSPSFEPMNESHFIAASKLLLECEYVIDAGTHFGTLNQFNHKLLKLAEENNIPVRNSLD
ncbi:MAG: ABC transporter ATP-binding protein [Clostridia bacterium]|nr:ABC transporter ATP-binding protein [Clostridia bacterium]